LHELTADLLPTPLYVIYSQLVAAREALHINCNANIGGSLEEAQHFASMTAAAVSEPVEQDEDPYKVRRVDMTLSLCSYFL
jgi:hypothetical protein